MVLYFTGTGNSRYVAEQIAKALDDEIVSINDVLKMNEAAEFKSKDKPYVIVTPIYGWKIPSFIEKFLKESIFNGTMRFYVIGTCGGSSGDAYCHLYNLCTQNNIKLKGFAEVKMPDNYVMLYDVPVLDDVKSDILAQQSFVNDLANSIKNDEEFVHCSRSSIKNKILSSVGNKVFTKVVVNAKGFYTTDKCNLCGKCEGFCSFNNIKRVNNEVKWGAKCTHCCSCIAQCPNNAIQYKKSTTDRKRYYLPKNSQF